MITKITRLAFVVALGAASGLWAASADLTAGMKEGAPDLKSVGPIEFGPSGILFVSDPAAASLFAIATGDTTPVANAPMIKADGINQTIAALLGTTADQIQIRDVAVNPVSKQTYISVMRGLSTAAVPALIRVKPDGKPELVSLDKVKFSSVTFPNPPSDVATGRGGSPRLQSVTDLAFTDGRVLIAGLSNEEFSSTLRSVEFPFKAADKGAGIQIYHGNHGRFETNAPIRTFVPYTANGQQRIYAAYTCTPLVDIAMSELVAGAKVNGKTIADLGAGNTPIDMIAYTKDGKSYLLMANSAKGVMKLSTENLPKLEAITAQVPEKVDGLNQVKLDWAGVDHLSAAGNNVVVLAHTGAGATAVYNLDTRALP